VLPDFPPFTWFQTVDENGNPKTVDELVEALENYLGPNVGDVVLEDGAIRVVGNPGKANEDNRLLKYQLLTPLNLTV